MTPQRINPLLQRGSYIVALCISFFLVLPVSAEQEESYLYSSFQGAGEEELKGEDAEVLTRGIGSEIDPIKENLKFILRNQFRKLNNEEVESLASLVLMLQAQSFSVSQRRTLVMAPSDAYTGFLPETYSLTSSDGIINITVTSLIGIIIGFGFSKITEILMNYGADKNSVSSQDNHQKETIAHSVGLGAALLAMAGSYIGIRELLNKDIERDIKDFFNNHWQSLSKELNFPVHIKEIGDFLYNKRHDKGFAPMARRALENLRNKGSLG